MRQGALEELAWRTTRVVKTRLPEQPPKEADGKRWQEAEPGALEEREKGKPSY